MKTTVKTKVIDYEKKTQRFCCETEDKVSMALFFLLKRGII